MAEFPDDLIIDILSRLPAKPLLRFRCVSKHWFALIDSNNFIKQHLNHSIITKSNHTLILHQFSPYALCSINPFLSDQTLETVQPINPNCRVTNLIGSCNGLLCLSAVEDYADVIIVWNPATRKYVKLPAITVLNSFTDDSENIDILYGFGNNLVTDDYNVLMLVQYYEGGDDDNFRSEANIYSLSLNMWRKVWNFPNYRAGAFQAQIVLAGGALNWSIIIGKESDIDFESRIASFDIVTEECMIFTQPNITNNGHLGVLLWELGGDLSIICNYYGVGVVDVWLMKNYGVAESWTKLFTIGSEVITSYGYLLPLDYSESDDEILLMVNSAKLLWYNQKKKTIKSVDVCGISETCYPVVCLESLVSLGDNAQNDENLRRRE